MTIPINTLRRREKMFGEGRSIPLDRNAKARIMTLARALIHPTEKRKHYGLLTAKFVMVLEALLWGFHNTATGRCFPSYERISERARCDRSTVYAAIHALEDPRVGILTWANRIVRVREWGPDLFGRARNRWRVIRTSNAYRFRDPNPGARPSDSSKLKFSTGTGDQEIKSLLPGTARREFDPTSPLNQALSKLGNKVQEEAKRPAGVEVAVARSVPRSSP